MNLEQIHRGGRSVTGFGLGENESDARRVMAQVRRQRDALDLSIDRCTKLSALSKDDWKHLSKRIGEYLIKQIEHTVYPFVITSNADELVDEGMGYIQDMDPWYDKLKTVCADVPTKPPPLPGTPFEEMKKSAKDLIGPIDLSSAIKTVAITAGVVAGVAGVIYIAPIVVRLLPEPKKKRA